MNLHEKYMRRCMELAQKGFGAVAPNPMVGCVLVCNGKIIGEGFHGKFGASHAEAKAIEAVKEKELLKHAFLYVNLEPCAHFGKMPPCTELIIASGVKKAVVGSIDPNPLVNGRGIQQLVSAGCDVQVVILEEECRMLNCRFFTFHEKKRPYIILKWVQTADGYMGIRNEKLKITGSEPDITVHQWRNHEQAIMVGTNTAIIDNPKLTVRLVKGKNPLRIVLDEKLKIPSSHFLLDKKNPTIVFTGRKKQSSVNLEFITIDFTENILKQVMHILYTKNIQSVLVEGGARLLNAYIKEGLWDEARIFTAEKKLYDFRNGAKGIKSPFLSGKETEMRKAENGYWKFFRNTF